MYTSHLERYSLVAGSYSGQRFTGKIAYKSQPIYERAIERLYWDLTIQTDLPVHTAKGDTHVLLVSVNNQGSSVTGDTYSLDLAYTAKLIQQNKAEKQRSYAIKLIWEYRAQTLDQMEVMQELGLVRSHADTYNTLYTIASDCASLAWWIDSLPAHITEVE